MKNNKIFSFSFLFSMRLFFLILFLLLSNFSFTQEENLLPIFQTGNVKNKKNRSDKDTLFVYLTDTLNLPLVDDFSEDHFQKYSKSSSGNNIKNHLYYKYLSSNDLKIDSKKYSSTLPQKKIHFYTQKKDSVAFIDVPSLKIKVANFSNYPIVYSDLVVYPDYTIFDTLEKVNELDTIWYSKNEFSQDSLVVIVNSLKDNNSYWLDSNVYRNDHYAVNPWTLGVVTFDGLNSNGFPYFFNTSIRDYGDFLTSKPINLEGYKLKDSIYFSFLYQPKGYGDAPENINVGSTSKHDSLCLQFFNPTRNQWTSIWSETVSQDPEVFLKQCVEFKKVHIRFSDSTYFKKNFQFRFVNYGDLSGSLDHFHLDYVKFRKNSGYQDTLFKDFSFVYPVKSILKKYSSVPWTHFVKSNYKPISDSIKIQIRNGSNIDENNQDGKLELHKNGLKINDFPLEGQKLSNGIVNFSPFTFYTSYFDFKNQISIPNIGEDTSSIQIIASVSAPFLNLAVNDTSKFTQKFKDYYAYDDGSAEAGYGLKSAQACMAYRFSTLLKDSILGAYIYFLPSVNDKSQKQFSLTLWSDKNGVPGEIIYEDDDFSLHNPIYGSKRDEFIPFYFKDYKRILVDTSFFIGIRQIDKDFLNIGFDRNTNTISHLFYSTDKINWNKSQVDTVGSLMIRPIFVSQINKTVSTTNLSKPVIFTVYPNPVQDKLFINSTEKHFKLTDIHGREILFIENNNLEIDVTSIEAGVYFLSEIKTGLSQKIIIK